MLAVRLPPDLEARLAELSARTGRSRSYYARQALATYIDDLEEVYVAEARLEDIRAGRDATHPLADLLQQYAE
jgi:RHH-type transcriptional regulator, rel operon repressor / antitoxin RelB